jgi:hypothetical protein
MSAQALDRQAETQMDAMRATLRRQAAELEALRAELEALRAEALAPNGHPWKGLHTNVCMVLSLMTSDRDEAREALSLVTAERDRLKKQLKPKGKEQEWVTALKKNLPGVRVTKRKSTAGVPRLPVISIRAGGTPRRWQCTLSCGHEVWIRSIRRPEVKKTTFRCRRCP